MNGPKAARCCGKASLEVSRQKDIYWRYHHEVVVRTLIDLLDVQVRALDELSRRERRSRAALIRQAVDEYLSKRRGSGQDDAFGLWGDRRIDGLAYQEKLRGEW